MRPMRADPPGPDDHRPSNPPRESDVALVTAIGEAPTPTKRAGRPIPSASDDARLRPGKRCVARTARPSVHRVLSTQQRCEPKEVSMRSLSLATLVALGVTSFAVAQTAVPAQATRPRPAPHAGQIGMIIYPPRSRRPTSRRPTRPRARSGRVTDGAQTPGRQRERGLRGAGAQQQAADATQGAAVAGRPGARSAAWRLAPSRVMPVPGAHRGRRRRGPRAPGEEAGRGAGGAAGCGAGPGAEPSCDRHVQECGRACLKGAATRSSRRPDSPTGGWRSS